MLLSNGPTCIPIPLQDNVDPDWVLPIVHPTTEQPGLQISQFRDQRARDTFPMMAFTYMKDAETFYHQLNDSPGPLILEDGTVIPGMLSVTIHNIRRCPFPGERIQEIHGQSISGRTLSEVVQTMLTATYSWWEVNKWRQLRSPRYDPLLDGYVKLLPPEIGEQMAYIWTEWWRAQLWDDAIYFVAVRRTKPDQQGKTYMFPQVELRFHEGLYSS